MLYRSASIAVAVSTVLLSGAQAAFADPTAAPQPASTPAAAPPCDQPHVPARMVDAASPDIPAMARQQNIFGDVVLIVSLDANSHVTEVRIRSSPSVVLNQAALSAARRSTYQTEVYRCMPVASQLLVVESFRPQ